MNNRLLTQVMEMDVTIKQMAADLEKQNAAIKTLRTEKKTLVSLIAGMKATISDLNGEDRKVLTNALRKQLDNNAQAIEKIDDLKKVLAAHDLGVSILGTTVEEDITLIRGLLRIIDDIKKDLDNEELNKNIQKAFDTNISKFRKRLGWSEDLSVEKWTKIEMEQYSGTSDEGDLVDMEKYNNRTSVVDMMKDMSTLFNEDDTLTDYQLDNDDEVDYILNQITDYQNRLLPEDEKVVEQMPVAEALSDIRKDQFLQMDPSSNYQSWEVDNGMQKIGIALVFGLFVCVILLVNAIKKRHDEMEEKRRNRNHGETRSLTSL